MVAALSRISGGPLPTRRAMATVRAVGPSVGRSRPVMRVIPRMSAARADSPCRMNRSDWLPLDLMATRSADPTHLDEHLVGSLAGRDRQRLGGLGRHVGLVAGQLVDRHPSVQDK